MHDSERRARHAACRDRRTRAGHPISVTSASIHSTPPPQTMRAGRIGRPVEKTGDRVSGGRAKGGFWRRSREGRTGGRVEEGGRPRGGGPLEPTRGADAPPSGAERSRRTAKPIVTARAVGSGCGCRAGGWVDPD
eukprot:6043463-Pleurochrysis_carterae.AAC.1